MPNQESEKHAAPAARHRHVDALLLFIIAAVCVRFGRAADNGTSADTLAPSNWALRMEIPDTFYEDVTVRARLTLTNTSDHSLQMIRRISAADRLPEQSTDVFLRYSTGNDVPRVHCLVSDYRVRGPAIETLTRRADDSLIGFSNITSLYQTSEAGTVPRPLRLGSYSAYATCVFQELRGGALHTVRIVSEPEYLRIVRPPDSLCEAQLLLREARATIAMGERGPAGAVKPNRIVDFYLTPREATQRDSATVLLRRILEEYGNTSYGPEAALELRERLSLVEPATLGLSPQDRDSIRATLVAMYPDDPFIDLYADGVWFGTKQQSRPVLLRVWSHAPAGSRLAGILARYQADTR